MATSTPTLPSYFPRKIKACAGVADTFFACFSEKSVQPEGGDPDAGVKALQACSSEAQQYRACMDKHYNRTGVLYRVPEAYRDQASQK